MGILNSFLRNLPMYLLSLPVLLMAFSVHESAHGYMAYKLGDPTARNLGRITLNPFKHLDPLGTICMIVAHVGWAKPVPINTRNFRKPKRDMALTGAAGPLSNLCLAVVHLLILRISLIFIGNALGEELRTYAVSLVGGSDFTASFGFMVCALLVYILYLGVILNINLAVFNLIPVPPFDGSRIFYAFLPQKWYFSVMKYERYIMIAFLLLLAFGALSGPLTTAQNFVSNGFLKLAGLGNNVKYVADMLAVEKPGVVLFDLMYFIGNLLA